MSSLFFQTGRVRVCKLFRQSSTLVFYFFPLLFVPLPSMFFVVFPSFFSFPLLWVFALLTCYYVFLFTTSIVLIELVLSLFLQWLSLSVLWTRMQIILKNKLLYVIISITIIHCKIQTYHFFQYTQNFIAIERRVHKSHIKLVSK